MQTEKMAILSMYDISEETQEILIDMATHEHSISCIETGDGFIINITKFPGGERNDTGIEELDEILPKVNGEGCDWIFFKE